MKKKNKFETNNIEILRLMTESITNQSKSNLKETQNLNNTLYRINVNLQEISSCLRRIENILYDK